VFFKIFHTKFYLLIAARMFSKLRNKPRMALMLLPTQKCVRRCVGFKTNMASDRYAITWKFDFQENEKKKNVFKSQIMQN